MPMVNASAQTSPPMPPIGQGAPPWPANQEAGPSRRPPSPRPVQANSAPDPEKRAPTPTGPTSAAPRPVPPAPPRIQIVQPPRTPCVAQPVAILGYLAGVGLGVTMGLSYAGIVPPIAGIAALVLSVMLLLFLAGAPPFHTTYPAPGPRPT